MVFNAEHLRRILAANSCEICDLLMRCELTSRLGRTRPAHVRSRGSETLLRIRSLAGYTIDTHESRFRKRHLLRRAHTLFAQYQRNHGTVQTQTSTTPVCIENLIRFD